MAQPRRRTDRRAAGPAPSRRGVGTAEDVATAALFLASHESGWVTGTNVVVDGGFCAG